MAERCQHLKHCMEAADLGNGLFLIHCSDCGEHRTIDRSMRQSELLKSVNEFRTVQTCLNCERFPNTGNGTFCCERMEVDPSAVCNKWTKR